MTPSSPALDELLEGVRDSQSKAYAGEAVAAYRAGAHRSAVLSLWAAVTFDLIAKIRELASLGDPGADKYVSTLDRAIATDNRQQLQAIERALLDTARQQFELLSSHEQQNLTRLQEDRHLCAHPALVDPERLFAPAPEAVLAHLVHALRDILTQQPVQGKSALARIKQELMRPSFPSDRSEAANYLDARYLLRAKTALAKSLITIILKAICRGDDPDLVGRDAALANALFALQRRFPDLYADTVRPRLPALVADLDDGALANVFHVLALGTAHWEWLGTPQRARLLQFLANVRLDHKETLRALPQAVLAVPPLADPLLATLKRYQLVSSYMDFPGLLGDFIATYSCPPFVSSALELYSRASSWRGAEDCADRVLFPLLQFFTPPDIARLLEVTAENDQIWHAHGTPAFLEAVFDATADLITETGRHWVAFVDGMITRNGRDSRYSYPGLAGRLQQHGLALAVNPFGPLPE